MEKKPLYRKVSKTTHNGYSHADFGWQKRSRWSRNTKEGMDKKMSTRHPDGVHKLHDYTPLFKFLLKQEGRDWDEVWKECLSRLDSSEPILWMVVNVNSKGLVLNKEVETGKVADDWKGRTIEYGKSFGYGEGAKFSTMYVDENNKLQFVDKNYVPGPDYEVERKWGETFNGYLYETYKRPAKKVEKMKSYIKTKN